MHFVNRLLHKFILHKFKTVQEIIDESELIILNARWRALPETFAFPVCAEYNHVRSWSVTRFRGMISTQPGSMPLASFKIISVDDPTSPASYATGNDFG